MHAFDFSILNKNKRNENKKIKQIVSEYNNNLGFTKGKVLEEWKSNFTKKASAKVQANFEKSATKFVSIYNDCLSDEDSSDTFHKNTFKFLLRQQCTQQLDNLLFLRDELTSLKQNIFDVESESAKQ